MGKMNQAEQIYDSLYLRGHGREATISRFMALIGVKYNEAMRIFNLLRGPVSTNERDD